MFGILSLSGDFRTLPGPNHLEAVVRLPDPAMVDPTTQASPNPLPHTPSPLVATPKHPLPHTPSPLVATPKHLLPHIPSPLVATLIPSRTLLVEGMGATLHLLPELTLNYGAGSR